MQTRDVVRRAGILAAAAVALLLLPCCNQSPEAKATARQKLQGSYTGKIRNRVRLVRLDLDKAGHRIEPRPPDSPTDRIIVAQGEDVQITITSKDAPRRLELAGFVPTGRQGEVHRAQSAPAAPAGQQPVFAIELKAGAAKVVMLDADSPGEFTIISTLPPQGAERPAPSVDRLVLEVQPRLFVLRWVARYGLLALFALLMFGIAGIPLPDEVMLSFAGGLAATGNYSMHYLTTLLTAFAGASCGITFSYVLGRTAGLGVVHKWGRYLHVTEERLSRVHEWYEHKKGRWALVFCIYAPVFRHVVAIVAGTSRMRFWEFAVLAYSGVLLWVATFITIGFFFAGFWVQMGDTVHTVLLVGSLGFGALVLIWFILKNRRDHLRHAQSQPAAPPAETGKDKEKSQAE